MDARWGLGSGNTVGKKLGLAGRHGSRARISRRSLPSSGGLSTIVILVLALMLPATSSLGQGGWTPTPFEIGADDFRMTWFGTDGTTVLNAGEPSTAYNSRNNEFLVVWEGDKTSDGNNEIWGRRINAATGELIGTDSFQISAMLYDADGPDVVYNPTNHEYLVVWQGANTSGDYDIWGQRLNATTGAEIGTDDFRITDLSGPAGSPAVAHNSQDDEYLVVFSGNGGGELEIWGQRLDGATGAEVGTDDFRLSAMGTEGNSLYAARYPDVAYNSTDNNFLAVWEADDDTGFMVNSEYEIYGQLISAAGAEIGTDDIRLSDMGDDGSNDGQNSAVAYNSQHNEYLVIWEGFDDSPPAPPEAEGGSEIWGQRVNGTSGAEVGTNDFNISDLGVAGEWLRYATRPEVAYDPENDRYLVVFRGDDDASSCADGEYEMHGQFLEGATATDILLNDFRFSTMGADGDTTFQYPMQSTIAFGTGENNWLVVWRSDHDDGALVIGEWELYGQLLTSNLADFFIADEPTVALPGSLQAPAGR